MDGVILVDKEKDFTSFDVVAKLRGILHMKKIGHGGTLDPQATGVLPVFLGSATRLCDYLPDERKVYEAGILLGVETDTEDIFGTVLRETTPDVSEEMLREAILSFIGDYDQIPPMVSAKKVDGKKLYELARKGIVIERQPVRLRIDDIVINEIDLPNARFTVSCEKGTYIRTLCADIGKKLGCGACMSSLRRLRHGEFLIDQAHTLSEIEEARDRGLLNDWILPVESVLPYPSFCVKPEASKLLMNGNRLRREDFEGLPDESETSRIKVCDPDGRFMGVYRYYPDEDLYKPDKMFLPQ